VPNRTDQQLRDVIRTGKAQMPGYQSEQISDEQMEHLITYMRSLK
jgi:mono/diheme cytochrome c family protein